MARARPGQLKPLIGAGLLASGQTLTWTQPRLRRTHTATVTAEGRLRLPDGTTWYSPYQAAKELTGYSADGWKVFTDDQGRTLADLAAAVPAT